MSPEAKIHPTEALDRDAAVLIALWLHIYGGDPPPQQVEVNAATGALAAAMAAQLRAEFGAVAPLSDAELEARLARLGLEFGTGDEHARNETLAFHPRFYCVKGPDGAPGCCVGTPFRITQE